MFFFVIFSNNIVFFQFLANKSQYKIPSSHSRLTNGKIISKIFCKAKNKIRCKMMLRNRNLNTQQKGAGGAEKPKRKQGEATAGETTAAKRQAAHLVATNQDLIRDEPKPKRSKTRSSSNLPDITKTLCIDSSKKATSDHQISTALKENNANKTAAVLASRSRSTQKLQQPAADSNDGRPLDEPAKQLELAAAALFDFDREQSKELIAVSDYAQDIFTYHKYRERFFIVGDYFQRQTQFTPYNRAQLVNWMVDLQETFELNHETLYLAVKLFDLFMDRTQQVMKRSELQLIASVALLVSSKFDERAPPLIDDFIYLSDDAFNQEQMKAAERQLLVCVGYDLGAPLSYRFLRRFARVCKDPLETLTLARYILESSLMSLRFCRQSESLMAAAALLLARRMRGVENAWDPILQKCSGLALADAEPTLWALNRMLLQRKAKLADLTVTYKKYSHDIFHKVAAIKPLQVDNAQHRRERTFGSNKSTATTLSIKSFEDELLSD